MTGREVLAVLGRLDEAGVLAWIGGGWGIDALIGEQTRPHDDLDLSFRAEDEAALVAALEGLGLRLDEDQRPVRFVMRAPDGGRAVDLHPVVFDAAGNGVQMGFDGRRFLYPADGLGWGRIDGVAVRCLTAAQQMRFHLGYPPTEKDRRDMALLGERLGIAPSAPY